MPFCPREEIRSQRLLEVAAYLDSKRRDDGSVGRADIDPIIDIPRLAPLLILAEQDGDGSQRIRLMGSKATQIMRLDLTGKRLDQLCIKPEPDWPVGGPASVFATDSLFCGYLRLPWEDGDPVEVEWIAQRMIRKSSADLALVAFDHRVKTGAR